MFTIIRKADGTHDVLGTLPPKMTVRKKPIDIQAYKINEPFLVETLEGVMKGKAGDYLMVGINDEMYPCDADIFEKTYDILAKEK